MRPLAVPVLSAKPSPAELTRCPSVQLFVERAADDSPDLTLTPADLAVVAEICVRLEGIPLAIELAAARARVLALEQIRDRLDDCIGLLTGGSLAAPSRRQTLRGALDWSYKLLDDSQKATFRRLGAFVGWLDLDAAEAVCGDLDTVGQSVLDRLAQLADKSLLVIEHGPTRARYRLLEPVRQYARQRLGSTGEAEAIYSRHLEYYVVLAERLEPSVWGGAGDQSATLDHLESLHDNLSAALAWGVAESPQLAARLAGSLWHFWRLRGLVGEGLHWLESLLSNGGYLGSGWGKATVGAAFLAREASDLTTSEALSYRAIAIGNERGDAWAKGMALLNLGMIANLHGDVELARQSFVECLAHCRQIRHQWGIGSALYHLGYIARLGGDLASARDLLEESLAVHHSIGDSRGVSVVLGALGRVYFLLGEPDRASAYMEESRAIGRRTGIRDNSGLGLAALLARSTGDYARARDLTRQGLDLLYSSGLHQHVPEHLCIQGTLLVDCGIWVEGVKLISAAIALGVTSGQIDSLVAHTLAEASLDAAKSALGERAYGKAWEEGRLLSLERAVELATGALPRSRTMRAWRRPRSMQAARSACSRLASARFRS